MFGSVLEVTSKEDLDSLVQNDPRYAKAVEDHMFTIKDKYPAGRQSYVLDCRYEARLKSPWEFASWVRDSGLFSETEVSNLILWVSRDHF